MKFFIVGLHGNGKHEIYDTLKSYGVRCGRLFSDIDEPSEKFYGSLNYELFTTEEINKLFENNAYIFIQRIDQDGKSFYEGISQYEFDNNDVFVLSPDQVVSIPLTNIREPYCFVWVDNTRVNRYSRYLDDGSKYDFSQREKQESKDLGYFINVIYDSNQPVLYFNNDDPQRIACIVYALVKYPDLLPIFKESFNN